MYRRLLKPLLFLLPPEAAHHLAIFALKGLGRAPRVRAWVESRLRVEDPSLRVTLGEGDRALAFPNPVGLAAGFDKNAEALPGLQALGFGFMEGGTLTPRPQPGNPGRRLFRVPRAEALVNRLGFNNRGAIDVAARFAGLFPSPWRGEGRGEGGHRGLFSTPLGFNIGKNKDTPAHEAAQDYLTCLEALHPWADFFVANVSSPNTPGLRNLQAPKELEPLLEALARRNAELSAKAGRPAPHLFVKISPDEEFGEAAAEIALRQGFTGIVATNTTLSRAGLPAGVPTAGGLSGRPLFSRSTEWVRRVHRAGKGRLAVIGVGGVFSAREAYKKILAGASLVEVYTGLIYRGPALVRDINRGLAEFLRRDGFRTVADAVGKGNP